MTEFRVADLASQAGAVARHIEGWPREEVLAWLSQYGEVLQVYPNNDDVYRFTAPSGLWTGFILRRDGDFLIIGDHTTYRPRRDDPRRSE